MMADVSPAKMIDTLLARFSGSVAIDAWGETSLFYNPGRILPRSV